MVLDPTGDIGSVIELRDAAAKNGSGRLIPVHPDLRQALAAYRSRSTGIGPLIDFALYAERNLVERFFNTIKHFRGIATRYEKTARNYLAGLHLVCALAWLK
jgi:transposase